MHIPDIEITRFRKIISTTLSEKFTVNQVTVNVVNPSDLYDGHIWESEVYAFEFIINSSDRYFTFCIVRNGRVMFTRPKEGIQSKLAGLIRPNDFGLMASGDYLRFNDVIGKFIECQINLQAHKTIQEVFDLNRTVADKDYDVVLGYNITRRHKTTMSFDCDFEALIKEKEAVDYTRYHGEMINGKLAGLYDVDNKSINLRDVFI